MWAVAAAILLAALLLGAIGSVLVFAVQDVARAIRKEPPC